MKARAQFTRLLTFILLLAFYLASGHGQSPEQTVETCKTVMRLPLSLKSNGIDGYLELLQDKRLTTRLSSILWGTGGINIDDDPELVIFKEDPPHNVAIQVVDKSGKVLETKELERPLAKIRAVQLYGDSRLTYLLTVDYSAGFGSYAGPITSLVEVINAQMQWVESTEVKTGKTGEIRLMESLKTTWKVVETPDRRAKQILLAQCRPDLSPGKDDPDFTTTYTRLYFDGTKWLAKVRTVKGLSEFDQGFPSPSLFPR